MTRKVSEADRAHARGQLRDIFRPGDDVHVFASEFSRGGYSARTIAVFAMTTERDAAGRKYPGMRNVSHLVATALGYRLTDSHGVRVTGGGMDMEFHLIYSLARELYGNHVEELTPAQKRRLTRWRKGELDSWSVPDGPRDAGYSLRKVSH